MSGFKKTVLDTYNTSVTQITSDQRNWNQLSVPVIVKEFTEVNYVDACPSSTYLAAVSTGPKVVIYNSRIGRAVSTISRFHRTAYGASYRQDGNLLVAGSEDSYIRLFECRNNDQLRVFKGHAGPVRRVKFIPGFPPRIVSFSDDKTAAIWDISDETKIMELTGHTDFVRAGCVNPCSPQLVVSGSDDRTVRVWDTRTGEAVFTLDHGTSHVNDVLCYPSGNVLASAAGSEVRIWDLTAGKLLSKLCRHHKDVTSLALATKSSRLVSGSLDRHLKVHDTNTYNLVHSVECAASVLSFAVMPEDSGLVVGMIAEGKGIISLQKKSFKEEEKVEDKKEKYKIKASSVKIIKEQQLGALTTQDNMLRRFEHSKYLVAVMAKTKHSAAAVVAQLTELNRRGGLQSAVAGQDVITMRRLVVFLAKNFPNPSFQPVLLDVINVVLDVYGDKVHAGSPMAGRIMKLHEMVTQSRQQVSDLMGLEGDLQMILASSNDSAVSTRCLAVPQAVES